MGLYDTMNQVGTSNPTPNPGLGGGNSIQSAVPNGGSFAQKQQMKANPMMGRPGMSRTFNQNKPVLNNMAAGLANAYQNRASNQVPSSGGVSNAQLMQKQLAMKNQQAAQEGGSIGGSYNQLLQANPQLQQLRQTGQSAGQDMGWMDKPGALQVPAEGMSQLYGSAPLSPSRGRGIQDVASQMGYGGPPPRQELSSPPFGGERPGNPGFQSMMENMGGQRPDIMNRGGIGPSAQMFGSPLQEISGGQQFQPQPPVQMDENGLEPRRGAR